MHHSCLCLSSHMAIFPMCLPFSFLKEGEISTPLPGLKISLYLFEEWWRRNSVYNDREHVGGFWAVFQRFPTEVLPGWGEAVVLGLRALPSPLARVAVFLANKVSTEDVLLQKDWEESRYVYIWYMEIEKWYNKWGRMGTISEFMSASCATFIFVIFCLKLFPNKSF